LRILAAVSITLMRQGRDLPEKIGRNVEPRYEGCLVKRLRMNGVRSDLFIIHLGWEPERLNIS